MGDSIVYFCSLISTCAYVYIQYKLTCVYKSLCAYTLVSEKIRHVLQTFYALCNCVYMYNIVIANSEECFFFFAIVMYTCEYDNSYNYECIFVSSLSNNVSNYYSFFSIIQ